MTTPLEEYDFKMLGELQSYQANMPVVDTDQMTGRCHECPICGKRYWSCWANARKHWQGHEKERRGMEAWYAKRLQG